MNWNIEWNNGWKMEWNDECIQLQLIHAAGPVQSSFELSTMSLALLSHHRGCMSKSSVAGIPFLSDIMMSRSENRGSLHFSIPVPSTATKQLMTSYCTIHEGHAYYCQPWDVGLCWSSPLWSCLGFNKGLTCVLLTFSPHMPFTVRGKCTRKFMRATNVAR